MYELIRITDRSYYVQSPTNVGIVKLDGSDVCLIDSGIDKGVGRKILHILDENGWNLKVIYNTHAHADHIGANKYLQDRTGCKVYASGINCDIARHPLIGPSFLYGGYPSGDLRGKFLMAPECNADCLDADVLPDGFEIIDLAGHAFDMVGFRTPDDVVYLGDCLASEATLKKYRVVFIYDVAAYLNTLEKVKDMRARLFVPSHAEPASDMRALAIKNIDAVSEVADEILRICENPVCFEAILQKLFSRFKMTVNLEQNVLVGCTLRSYLSWLKERSLLSVRFRDNLPLWERV